MSSVLDKLNLRPVERRVLVVVLTAGVVVVNFLFVWPYFGEWGRTLRETERARLTLRAYQAELNRTAEYETKLRELAQQGSAVLPAEQALQLAYAVQSHARSNNVAIVGVRPGTALTSAANTNQFFDEQTVAIDVAATDRELVDFLVAMGSGDSMIRVRDMDLRPDPPQYKLNGKITLVASYQKKPKPAASSPAASAAASQPATPRAAAPGAVSTSASPAALPPQGAVTARPPASVPGEAATAASTPVSAGGPSSTPQP